MQRSFLGGLSKKLNHVAPALALPRELTVRPISRVQEAEIVTEVVVTIPTVVEAVVEAVVEPVVEPVAEPSS